MFLILYVKVLMGAMFILLLGAEALALINRGLVKFNILEASSISYALGSGILTSLILMLMVFDLPITFIFIACVLILILSVGLFAGVRFFGWKDFAWPVSDAKRLFLKLASFNIFEKILVFAISLKCVYVFSEAMIKPVFSWDATGNHSLRAKALFMFPNNIIGHFSGDFVKANPFFGQDYPMQRSLLESWFYKCMGTWNDQLSKIIFPMMFVFLVMFFYTVARKMSPRMHALFFTFLLSTVPLFVYHATAEYADLSVCFYFSFAGFLLYLWSIKGERTYFYLSAVVAGVLPTVKAEGAAMILLLYFVVFSLFAAEKIGLKQKAIRISQYFAYSFPMFIWWFIFKRVVHLQAFFGLKGLGSQPILEKAAIYSKLLYKGLFVDGNWGLAYFAFVSLLIINMAFNFRSLVKRGSFFCLSLIFLFFAYLSFIYLFTTGIDSIGVNVNRVCISIAPLLLFAIGDQFYILKRSLRDPESVHRG